MRPEQRQDALDAARYLREVRPLDPAELSEYVEGQPHPAAVRTVLREHAPDLGVIEREDGTFVPVADSRLAADFEGVQALPERYVRRVEDKQIGHWFLQGEGNGSEETFYKSEVQNKVMFFLWDSVFASSKEPLAENLLGVDSSDLVTFGSFARRVDDFISAIDDQNWSET